MGNMSVNDKILIKTRENVKRWDRRIFFYTNFNLKVDVGANWRNGKRWRH